MQGILLLRASTSDPVQTNNGRSSGAGANQGGDVDVRIQNDPEYRS